MPEGCPSGELGYPWGRVNDHLLAHYRALGDLRKNHEALRLGDITFFQFAGGRLGFSRAYHGKRLDVYINRSNEPWEIPTENVLFCHGLTNKLAPMGYCVVEV